MEARALPARRHEFPNRLQHHDHLPGEPRLRPGPPPRWSDHRVVFAPLRPFAERGEGSGFAASVRASATVVGRRPAAVAPRPASIPLPPPTLSSGLGRGRAAAARRDRSGPRRFRLSPGPLSWGARCRRRRGGQWERLRGTRGRRGSWSNVNPGVDESAPSLERFTARGFLLRGHSIHPLLLSSS